MRQPTNIQLRINEAALTESVFKSASASGPTKQQENLRPRGQSRSSNPTGRSTNSEETGLYDGSFILPFRQPLNPPEATLIQKHAGFARFLKQHASPPHHRVTAGGRIVPAGPLSPPPFQLLPSINAVVTNPSSKSLAGKIQANLPETSTKGSNVPKTPTGAPAAPLGQQNVNANGPKPFDLSYPASVINNLGTAPSTQNQGPLLNHFGTNLGPLPPGATPIGFLPDGSPLAYFNGVSYQSYWDGNSTILKPLQLPTSAAAQMGYNAPVYPQMPSGPQLYDTYGSLGLAYPQNAMSSLPFTDGINDAQDQSQQFNLIPPVDHTHLHDQWTSQLTALDKYVALHLHEFSPAENARCTFVRRQLVEQLDNLRMSRESASFLNASSSMMFGTRAGPPWAAANETIGAKVNGDAVLPTTPVTSEPVTSQGYGFGLKGASMPSAPKTSKCLSPDAPPFVPAVTKAAPPGRFEVSQGTSSNDVQEREYRGETRWDDRFPDQATGKVYGNGNVLSHAPDKATADLGDGSRRSTNPNNMHYNMYSAGPDVGTTDPLPLVSMGEAEYANVPGFNPSLGPKLYCTTPDEFQEVIRRVREQAQTYGCKGGQSKDPAYDAEQDIRWAMADAEPILLPKSPADHVAKPRPWSWDDSAFNYRRDIAISPEWTSNSTSHRVHQQASKSTINVNRSRVDSWEINPSVDDFGKYKVSKRTTGEPTAHSHDPSSSSPVRKQPFSHSQSTTGHSIVQPYPKNLGLAVDRASSPMLDHAKSWTVNNAQLQRWVPQNAPPYGNSRPARTSNQALNDDREQYQPYHEDVPRTPARSRNPSGYSTADTSLGLRGQDSQQLWASPNQSIANADHKTSSVGAERVDSWQSNGSTQRSQTTKAYQHNLGEEARPNNVQDAEIDALSFDSQGIPYSGYCARGTFGGGKQRAAKVNLPPARGYTISSEGRQAPEAYHPEDSPAVSFAKVASDDTSREFLRGMLKSPRYSAARAHQSEPFGLFPYKMQFDEHTQQQQPAKRLPGKENVKSEDYQNPASGYGRGVGKNINELSNPHQSERQDMFANKARSSLAASSYHAVGRLPQYDGAGDLLISSDRQARSSGLKNEGASASLQRNDNTNANEAEDNAKVNQADKPKSPATSSRREQAKKYDVGPTDDYDYRGVTRKDFTVAPDRPSDLKAHCREVDRFFDRLIEEELQEVAATHGRDPSTYRRI
ncbi:MAG: hypothetical protein Q9166_003586 [cf. Caloplaca sp. 2 TL-2023]